MKSLNELIEAFKNLNNDNLIDIGIGLAIIIIFKIISKPIAYIIIKMFKFKEKDKNKIKKNAFFRPFKGFIAILGLYIGLRVINLPDKYIPIITKGFKLLIILLTANGFANLFDSDSDSFSKIKEKLHIEGTDTTISFFSRIAKVLIYIVTGFIIIKELGYDLSGLVTGLGITSVVIALAAQDLVKSMLAGLSILSDRPFSVGDYINVGDYSGTVEDITFRTTRIRDINNQIVVLPNSLLTNSSIINSTKREKRRYDLTLTLELNTPLDKISDLSENIKLILNEHDRVLKENIRVFFDTVSDNGIDLAISFYTDIINYNKFLEFKQEINYAILEIVKSKNIELAYNTQSIYLKKD